MSVYKTDKISDGFIMINDDRGNSMYLIEGNEKAALIDCGMSDEPLMPFLKKLTDKPISLILTHAHIDHMYRYEEFESVYIHKNEIASFGKKEQKLMDIGAVLLHKKRKKYPVSTFVPLIDSQVVSLGECDLVCFALPGHTKGSAVFADKKHKAVLCGDAVGSGAGVWMFLPDCDNLRQYEKGLSVACEYLSEYRNYRFYGGHNSQGLEEGASPLSYNTFCDMKELCEHIISGNEFSNNNFKKIPFVNLLWFRYKTAAIVTRKGKIKS